LSWKILYTNPGDVAREARIFDPSPKITAYSDWDRPNKGSFKVNAEAPIKKYGDIDLMKGGEVVLRGLVTDVETKGDGSQLIECYSKEWLLKKRFTFYYTYTHDDATVGEMLEDDLTGDYVGLLAMARSLLPPNMFSLYSGSTYKLTGGGTGSVFGSAIPYHDTTALTLGSGAGSLAEGQYWRNASDLYVRLVGSSNPRYELVSMADWCDPKVRLGDISDISAETFAAPYRLATGRSVWEYIQKLIKATGAYVRWRAEVDDPYLYLDASLTSFGRGTSTEGILSFVEPRYRIDRIAPDDVEVHGLIGVGAGDGKTIEMASTLDMAASGNIVLDVVRDGYLYESFLDSVLSQIYGERAVEDCHQIEGPEAPLLRCGDRVNVKRSGFGRKVEVVKKIDIRGDGLMRVWTGKRPRDSEDLIAATNALLQEQSSFAQSHLNMWSDSHTGNVTNSVPLKWEPDFSDENGIIDTSFAAATRIYLSFSLGWYKSDVSGADTRSHSHTGRTGSGGSSSHGNAGSGGGHYHEVTGATSAAESSSYARSVIGSLGTMSSAGGHSHSASGSSGSGGGGHAHQVTTAPGMTSTQTPYHIHSISVSVGSVGNHNHSYPWASPASVASSGHVHTVSGQTTATHAGHSDHAVTNNPTHDLPTYTEPLTAADVDKFLSEESTGSLKYLTVRLYANSVEVPGSPYEDYYIGDSEGAIDVTDLINIGGANEIEARISEYGGSGDVRCEISLSLTAQVVLTSI
jgi:hypothetical protein